MAKQYQAPQNLNRLMSWMARRGMGKTQLLSTTGRKSGQKRDVPVSPIEIDGSEYVVSPYGEVSWVRNVRADPTATLRHGPKERRVRLEETPAAEAAPVVAAYYERESYARQYMDVPASPTVDDFAARASMFPVFKVGTTD